MGTYSFTDVKATIVGPGGVIALGADAGVANEGISVAFTGDRNTMTSGADGGLMHSLHAARTGSITVRLLKTSPTNALLSIMFDLQQGSSALWGLNTIVVTDVARGDVVSGVQMAFTKQPDNTWATEGNTLEWTFQGKIYEALGIGNPTVA